MDSITSNGNSAAFTRPAGLDLVKAAGRLALQNLHPGTAENFVLTLKVTDSRFTTPAVELSAQTFRDASWGCGGQSDDPITLSDHSARSYGRKTFSLCSVISVKFSFMGPRRVFPG